MENMISFCGLDCYKCPTYIATKEDNDDMRKKVAEEWSKMFNMKLTEDNINCNGCLTENGKLFGHCKTCGIRKCGQDKAVKNCAYCDDYSCEQLDNFLNILPDPEARKNLERIKKEISE